MQPQKRISDKVLVSRFKKGSLSAFEEIMERYESKVFNMAMRFTRNQEDAEEVLQDVFTTLYTKIESFRGQSAFSSWLYRIIANAAFMKLRKRKQGQAMSIEDLSPFARLTYLERDASHETNSDTLSMKKQLRERMERAIRKLPDQYRSVFVLRDVDGMSNEEVSEILSLTIPAVKSRLHRSRLMLRRRLRSFYIEFTNKLPPEEAYIEELDGLL